MMKLEDLIKEYQQHGHATAVALIARAKNS